MRLPMVFSDGPWRLAMGLNALELADWLWFDGFFDQELGQKLQLLDERPDEVLALLPHGRPAAAELLALLIQHLPVHHQDRFAAVEVGVAIRATGQIVRNDDHEPLRQAGLLVQEDFCLMAPSAAGSYALAGAFLAAPSRWRLREKLGLPMRAIHAPVPGFADRLGVPVDRFFGSLVPERPVWRANWALNDEPTLFQPGTRTKPISITAEDAGHSMWLRVERQTLRRLPESRYIVFGIRTLVRRLDEVAALPGVAAALAARLREMPEAMLTYKNLIGCREPMLAWLDRTAGRTAAA